MPEISPSQAKELIASGAQVIDVRTTAEYEAGHIPDARHVPVDAIQSEAAALDREHPLVLYCRTGERSNMPADAFAASGWDAHSIEGGLVSWSEAGFELAPEGGSVAANPNMPPP